MDGRHASRNGGIHRRLLDRAARAALGAGHIELGYRYDLRFWGNGYATEAGAAMLKRGFVEKDLSEIVAIVNEENLASDRVIRKLGRNYQHTFEQEGMRIKFYKLRREEYRAAR